jgi:hypothetical protein
MHSRTFAVLLYGAVVLYPIAVAAQPASAQPNPAHPDAPVPAVKYESGFAGYVSFREEKLAPWREVNDEVARAGGHIGIVRGAAGHGGQGAAKPAAGTPVRAGQK